MSDGRLRSESVSRLREALDLQRHGRSGDAAAVYQALVEEDPTCADAWHLWATVALERRDYAAAEERIARALALAPGRAAYHHNIAHVHGALGRFDLARKHLTEAIRLKPDYAEAYFNLAGIVHWRSGDPFLGAVEDLLRNPSRTRGDRCFLHFAAGKACDDTGDHDRAFAHFRDGNAAKGLIFDARAERERAQAVVDAFSTGFFAARSGWGDPSERPVFVVGMPRSGTSLLEQCLAAHPAIHGAGELPDIPSIVGELTQRAGGAAYPAWVTAMTPDLVRSVAAAYLGRIESLAPAAASVVDKAPLNFLHLGFIRLLFPKARILHVRRDPRDTCLSCYFQNFRTNHAYSFDLAGLARFYRYYERLIEHWRAVLPESFLDVDYEHLVAEPERVVGDALAYLGLDWHPDCSTPESAERPVGTASRWQVRQPVNRASVGKWRRYRAHLGPLLEQLGPIPIAKSTAES